MAGIYLAHVTVYDPALPGTKTLYLSSSGYTTGSANLPPGGVAHTAYDPRIQQPANMRRDVFSKGTTGGASEVGYGALELVNIDGGLDSIADYGLDGQPITLIVGDVQRGSAPTWTTVLVGTMEQPEVTWSKVTIRLRDRQAELSAKPACPNKYAGNNSLPNGLEGVAGDIASKPKPRVYGSVFNIQPPCVNTSRLIYQLNDGAITSATIYDKGLALTSGADYTSQSDMETTAPTAGQVRVWPAGGYFRLGSTPAGLVTADVVQGAAAANRTVAQLIKQIATGPGGILAADVTAADVTALDTLNSAEVGVWLNDESCMDAMDMLCASIGAWWSFDRLGKLRMGRLDAPSGTPVAEIVPADIISIERVPSNDAGRGVSTWFVTLNYKRFWVVQASDIAGAVTDARRAELRAQYRQVTASDSAIKTKHLLSPYLTFETLLTSAAAASTEVSRRLTLYKAERSTVEVKVAYDASLVATIDLGNVIKLTVPRFGMSAGKLFVVTGLRTDLKNKLLYMTLWG